ncbi:hypothetical protein BC940DRAFT_300349 [Gongronella butleri]|nr:hypothetical protein BC940DRAFT_300349 [Gongronella butleri]
MRGRRRVHIRRASCIRAHCCCWSPRAHNCQSSTACCRVGLVGTRPAARGNPEALESTAARCCQRSWWPHRAKWQRAP